MNEDFKYLLELIYNRVRDGCTTAHTSPVKFQWNFEISIWQETHVREVRSHLTATGSLRRAVYTVIAPDPCTGLYLNHPLIINHHYQQILDIFYPSISHTKKFPHFCTSLAARAGWNWIVSMSGHPTTIEQTPDMIRPVMWNKGAKPIIVVSLLSPSHFSPTWHFSCQLTSLFTVDFIVKNDRNITCHTALPWLLMAPFAGPVVPDV
jgi:hypothetical protein